MHYEEARPIDALAGYVKCFWTLETDPRTDPEPRLESGLPDKERILPDGCMEIVFNLAEPFVQHHLDDTNERQPRILLVGQMRRHILIQPTGKVRLLGVRFWPGGAYPFLRFPQDEITDQIIDLDSAWGRTAREIEARIQEARSRDDQLRAVETQLLAVLNRFRTNRENFSAIVAPILRTGGRLPIDTLAKNAGLSRRQLDRLFNTRVGLPPKLLSRVVRFQMVFAALERDDISRRWAGLAVECGYSDQPHLIKDFKAFAGVEPTSYFSQANLISSQFTGNAGNDGENVPFLQYDDRDLS